ncbi:hypothetical protein LOK49_LG02G02514 [Camellia lanceoleosa]|uniref:Uncharacterized protein n=1 Tax=Camellia lanceoleosa TaxID=1840588 RepID=A0ACC0IRL3_9ERIC|nr:hypothetical protein LOK49_LG02G02514 [Camellia lanceoleosa]
MADTIDKIVQRLVLTAEEKEMVSVEESLTQPILTKLRLCLIGKLLSQRPNNIDVMKTNLISVWKPSKGVMFKSLGDNLFLFQFNHITDKKRVLINGPWNFDKHLVLLCDFDGSLQPSEISFSTATFWVRVFNIPLVSMTKDSLIGTKLGTFMDIEYGEDGIA